MEGARDVNAVEGARQGSRGGALYVVADASSPLVPPGRHALAGLHEVVVGRDAGRSSLRTEARGLRRLQLGLPDRYLSSAHLKLELGPSGWQLQDLGSKNGVRLDGARLRDGALLADGACFEAGDTFFLFRRRGVAVPLDLVADDTIASLTCSQVWAPRTAGSPRWVLVCAEAGARQQRAAGVHSRLQRRGRLLAIDCRTTPRAVLPSLLWGGAAGASGQPPARPGCAEEAEGGTLFLDHFEALPRALQADVVRLVDHGLITPVGGAPRLADVLLVLGSDHSLEELARSWELDPELLGRLGAAALHLPPLAERPEDLGLVLGGLLRAASARLSFETSAFRALLRHAWPGDVAELGHLVRHLARLRLDRPVSLGDLPWR